MLVCNLDCLLVLAIAASTCSRSLHSWLKGWHLGMTSSLWIEAKQQACSMWADPCQPLMCCRAAFDTLTDASSMLLASGEFSAHSNSREDFEREVAASDALDSVDIFADAAEPEDAAGKASHPEQWGWSAWDAPVLLDCV